MTAIELDFAPRLTGLFPRFRALLRHSLAPVEQNEARARALTANIRGKSPGFHGQWRVLKDL